jgi:hypothetical protein
VDLVGGAVGVGRVLGRGALDRAAGDGVLRRGNCLGEVITGEGGLVRVAATMAAVASVALVGLGRQDLELGASSTSARVPSALVIFTS